MRQTDFSKLLHKIAFILKDTGFDQKGASEGKYFISKILDKTGKRR